MSLRSSLIACSIAVVAGAAGWASAGYYSNRSVTNSASETTTEVSLNEPCGSNTFSKCDDSDSEITEDPLDRLISSENAQDINRALGGAQ